MSFMMRIEAAQRSPLDQLALDYACSGEPSQPSLDFCQHTIGVPQDDDTVAKRLGVAVSTVRAWRELGRRARWSCDER
jgi:hypothetical protein